MVTKYKIERRGHDRYQIVKKLLKHEPKHDRYFNSFEDAKQRVIEVYLDGISRTEKKLQCQKDQLVEQYDQLVEMEALQEDG